MRPIRLGREYRDTWLKAERKEVECWIGVSVVGKVRGMCLLHYCAEGGPAAAAAAASVPGVNEKLPKKGKTKRGVTVL